MFKFIFLQPSQKSETVWAGFSEVHVCLIKYAYSNQKFRYKTDEDDPFIKMDLYAWSPYCEVFTSP
jgi:hypothetical protein